MLGNRTPVSTGLVEGGRLARLAERVIGGAVLPSPADTQAIRYASSTGWHSDTAIPVRAVKFVAYLEPLGAESGALRVLPGSHHLRDRRLGWLQRPDSTVADAPGTVLATEPGDVVAFDPYLWHATSGGGERRQWTTSYLRRPRTPEEREHVLAWYADGVHWATNDAHPEFPAFSPAWVAGGSGDAAEEAPRRHSWVYALNGLGVLEMAGVADAFLP